MNWQASVERTVTALGYEVVDCERSSRGLLRVFIDRVPGQAYPDDLPDPASAAAGVAAAGSVTVDDCERVTRQLQYALEVDGCDYARLEVSSPGLDRPLRKPSDFERFADLPVDLTLKQPFQGRKKYRGTLRKAAAEAGAAGFELVFQDGKEDKVLGFALDEVREARLVPVLDFKGRRASGGAGAGDAGAGGKGTGGAVPGGSRARQGGDKGAGKRGMSGGHEQ
jgi:ribosome maturation factor RimP